jgi:hypothetical protein
LPDPVAAPSRSPGDIIPLSPISPR